CLLPPYSPLFPYTTLFRSKDHIEISQAVPGDIAAVAKIDELHFDAVLHDSHDEDHIHLAPMAFPKPMFGLAVEPASKGQEQNLRSEEHTSELQSRENLVCR